MQVYHDGAKMLLSWFLGVQHDAGTFAACPASVGGWGINPCAVHILPCAAPISQRGWVVGRKRVYASAADKQRAWRENGGSVGAVGRANVESYGVTKKNGAGAVSVALSSGAGVVYHHAAVSGLLVRVCDDLDGERVRAVVVAPGRSSLLPGVAYPFKRAALCEVQS